MATIEQAAIKLHMKERSLKRAVKESRIRYRVDDRGMISIPDDEIKPLAKSSIQSFLWVVFRYKNDPGSAPDVSTVGGVHSDDLRSVFKQLVFRGYLDQIEGTEDVATCFSRCRITQKGVDLLRGSRLPGSYFSNTLLGSGFSVLYEELLQVLPNWV